MEQKEERKCLSLGKKRIINIESFKEVLEKAVLYQTLNPIALQYKYGRKDRVQSIRYHAKLSQRCFYRPSFRNTIPARFQIRSPDICTDLN